MVSKYRKKKQAAKLRNLVRNERELADPNLKIKRLQKQRVISAKNNDANRSSQNAYLRYKYSVQKAELLVTEQSDCDVLPSFKNYECVKPTQYGTASALNSLNSAERDLMVSASLKNKSRFVGEQNEVILTQNRQLNHLSEKGLINAEFISDKGNDSDTYSVADYSLQFSAAPNVSSPTGKLVGKQKLLTSNMEYLLVDPADKRLVIGKSITDKYGIQSLCNLSIARSGTSGKHDEGAEQINEANSNQAGVLNFPTQQTLFPDDSTAMYNDIQENQFGDTVMISLKTKSIRKVEEKVGHINPDEKCFLVSPIQKKIILSMENRISSTSNGGIEQGNHNAQTADPKKLCSTVFLLKRKLTCNTRNNTAKYSPNKKSLFVSPLKKKQKLAKRKTCNQDLLIEKGEANVRDESLLVFSSVDASGQTSTDAEHCNREDDQGKYCKVLEINQAMSVCECNASSEYLNVSSSKSILQVEGSLIDQNQIEAANLNGTLSLAHHCSDPPLKRKLFEFVKISEGSFESVNQKRGVTVKNEQDSLTSPVKKKPLLTKCASDTNSSKRNQVEEILLVKEAISIEECSLSSSEDEMSVLSHDSETQNSEILGVQSSSQSEHSSSLSPAIGSHDFSDTSDKQHDAVIAPANATVDSCSIQVSRSSEPLNSLKHLSENVQNPIDKPIDTPVYSDGNPGETVTEEQFIISRFMKKMKMKLSETDEHFGIRVRAVAQKDFNDHPRGNAGSEKIDQHSNPTFQNLKVFSSAKLRKNVFQLQRSEPELINKIASRLEGSQPSAEMEAQCLVKWCLKDRKKLIAEFNKAYKSLVTVCDNWLTIAERYSKLEEKSEAILGLPQHSSSTEAYFYETAYKYYNDKGRAETKRSEAARAKIKQAKIKQVKQNRVHKTKAFKFPLEIAADGKVTNMFPETRKVKKSFKWDCSSLCKTNEKASVRKVGKIFRQLKNIKLGRQMVYFLRDMNKCNNSCCHSIKKGHSAICRMKDGNGASLVILQNLQPHYPHVQVVVRSLQSLKGRLKRIDDLESALYEGDCQKLEAIAEKAKVAGGEFKVGTVSFTSEDAIFKKYTKSFKNLKNKMEDLPDKYCFSCEKLHCFKNLCKVSNMSNIPKNKWWTALLKKEEDGVSVEYICHFCLLKIRAGQLPSISTLNTMKVPEVPAVIQNLNKFEKVFIQRAKAFQVVAKAGTVSGKNLPASHLNSKVVGRTFHLPLPLEQTLKRILRDEQAVMPNQEVYILVRGLPTNQKKVWESLVNVTNILKALEWLKMNNHLYKDIKLPNAAEKLLNPLEDIHYDDPDNPLTSGDIGKPPLSPLEPSAAHDPNEQSAPVDPNESDDAELAYDLSDIGAQPEDSQTAGGNFDSDTADSDNPDVERKDPDSTGDDSDSNAADSDGSDAEHKDAHHKATPTVADIAAMLTQRNKDDAFYDNFTIFPIYERRENTAPPELYQMLKVEGTTMDSRAQKLDAQCFPDLYPDGQNYFHEDREVKLQFTEFVKAKLMSRHPRFRMNVQYLFFLLNQLTTRQLAAGIYQTLNITRKKFTAGEFLNKLGEEDVEREMCSIFSRVRNTQQYWRVPTCQLYCMIENYGPATFFFTYSPSLYDDPDLRKYLEDVNEGKVAGKTTSQLIADDPVSVSRFCDQKFKGILEFLTKPVDGPLEEIVHYAWRREYQGRGTQHFHLLLWVKNAPVLGVSSGEEIAEFIQKHITCSFPDKNTFPTLHDKVMRYQMHQDNSYCLRGKGKANKKVCRFGFPRPITDKFILRDVPTSIAGRRNLKSNTRLYDLPRKEDEVRVNDYNPQMLLAVKHGNMDIQFVGEKSAIIVKYISKYVCKPEKSHMDDVFRDINSTKNQFKKLWSIGSLGLSNRECHALEAADTALGIPLFGTDKDTVFKWVDVGMFRSRKLKTKAQIEWIAKQDSKSTDLYCTSMIDDHYPHRPDEMEEVCLHDYARDYDIVKTKPKKGDVIFYEYPGFGYLRKRTKPYLINHYHYDFKQQPENYFYSILLLYKPWRRIEDLKSYIEEGEVCQYANFTEAFEGEKDSLQDALQHHEKRTVLQAAHEAVTKLIDEKAKEFGEEAKNIDFEIADDPHGIKAAEANEAMKEYREAAANLDDEDLSSLEGQLNEDQLRVYDYVKSALQSKTPMRHYVSGVGGTGKSFLIKCIAKHVREKLKKDVAITAPTGIASFNIQGSTVFRVLQLPIQHGKDFKYTTLNDTVLNILRLALKNTVVLIIDEISMVSNLLLMFINLRLNEIFNTFHEDNAFFGNIHILVFGDLLQLPPVKGSMPFQKLTKTEIKDNFISNSGFPLWSLFTYDELRINMRQKNDQKFAELLANIRLGFYSSDNIQTLLHRKLVFQSNTPEGRTKELAEFVLNHEEKPVVLLPTRKMCHRLNTAVLSLLDGAEIHLMAQDSVDCRSSDKSRAMKALKRLESDCTRTAGLEKQITVKIGARVMLRRNIDVSKGYVNGAIGTILSAKTRQDGTTICLRLQMTKGDILELTPMLSKFELSPGIFIHRKQFAIQLAYGLTIHKAQGLSLNCVIVDVGNQSFSEGQTYVALSRVTTLSGLHIINIDPSWIKAKTEALAEYARLRSMTKHLKSIAEEVRVRTEEKEKIKDDVWAPKVESANVFDETPPPKKVKESSLLPAFENIDKVSCYANTILQCLLSYEPLRSALRRSAMDSALKQIADRYVKTRPGELLSALDVRKATDAMFAQPKMEDATVFLLFLISKSDVLKQMTDFTESLEKKCSSCKATTVIPQLWSFLQMPPDHKKVSDFLQKRSSWSAPKDFECPSCHKKSKAIERFLITNPSNLFIVKVLLWDVNADGRKVKNTKFQMTALPSANLKVGDCRFKLHAAAFHSGKGQIEVHHTAIVQLEKKCILADDSDISECKWPRGSKGAFLLFYCRIDGKKNVQAPFKPPLGFAAKLSTTAKTKVPRDATAEPRIYKKTDASSSKAPLDIVAKPEVSKTPKALGNITPKPSNYQKWKKSELLPAFENPNIACYANASLQCLLSYEPLRSALSASATNTALKTLAEDYRNGANKVLSAYDVRVEIDDEFAARNQQDAPHFLLELISKHSILQQMTKFTEVQERKCCRRSCGATSTTSQNQNLLKLPTVDNHKTIAELLTKYSSTQPVQDFTCSTCLEKDTATIRYLITNPNKLFIIQLLLYSGQEKNTAFRMNEIQSIIIDKYRYQLHGAVFHHGEKGITETGYVGHYTAIVKTEGNYILANDAKVQTCSWPEGSKGVYLLFYGRIDGKESVPTPSEALLDIAAKPLISKKTEVPGNATLKPQIRKKTEALASKAPLNVAAKTLARKRPEAPTLMPCFQSANLANASLHSYEPEVSNVKTKRSRIGLEKQVSGIEAETAIPVKSEARSLPAFENESRVSCYANASLQSLLSYGPVRSALLHSEGKCALKDIANQYLPAALTRSTLSAMHVRRQAGHQFAEERQQDPHEFLAKLIGKNALLRENVKFTLVDCKRCDGCGYKPACNPAEYCMLSLPANEGETDITHILAKFLTGSIIPGSTCSKCQRGKYIESFVVQDPSDVFILHFKLWNNKMVKNKTFQMKGIPSSDLIIDSDHYRFHSATFHHGESVHSGHYTAIVKSGSKFILADDTEVTECSWPEKPLIMNQNGNEMAVNAYLLFYYKVK